MKKTLSLAIALASLVAAGSALASPAGYWQVTHYDFVTAAYVNDVQICLDADGTTRQANPWRGFWTQSGANLMTRAHTSQGPSTSADFVTVVDEDHMTGFNQSWPDKDRSGGYYTTSEWVRLKKAC